MANTLASSQGTAPGWVSDLLSTLKAPASDNNAQKLIAWNACEGNASGGSGLPINNPFNTTLSGYGGASVNSAGVKSYPTWSGGLQATVQTLQAARYKGIVTNLQSDGPQSAFASAVGGSGWGTNGACIAKVMGQPYNGPASPGGGTSTSGGGSLSGCVIKMPVTGSCILSKSNLKALKGGLLLAAGAGVFVVGALVLAAYGLEHTPAGTAARQTVRGLGPARRLVPARQAGPAADEGDELFEATRGSGAANRRAYRRWQMDDTSDLRTRTA